MWQRRGCCARAHSYPPKNWILFGEQRGFRFEAGGGHALARAAPSWATGPTSPWWIKREICHEPSWHARNHDCSAGVSRNGTRRARVFPQRPRARPMLWLMLCQVRRPTRVPAPRCQPELLHSFQSVQGGLPQQLSSLGLPWHAIGLHGGRRGHAPWRESMHKIEHASAVPAGTLPETHATICAGDAASREAPERWRTQATHAE